MWANLTETGRLSDELPFVNKDKKELETFIQQNVDSSAW